MLEIHYRLTINTHTIQNYYHNFPNNRCETWIAQCSQLFFIKSISFHEDNIGLILCFPFFSFRFLYPMLFFYFRVVTENIFSHFSAQNNFKFTYQISHLWKKNKHKNEIHCKYYTTTQTDTHFSKIQCHIVQYLV